MSTSSTTFLRYSALVSATFAGAASAYATPPETTVFDAPYTTGVLPITESIVSNGDISGAWTSAVFVGTATIQANSGTSLTLGYQRGSDASSYDFSTQIVSGFETISFSYITAGSAPIQSFGYTVNGSFNAVTGSGTVSNLVLSSGDIFGFRITVGYTATPSTLTISNLTATSAVPEPASAASWLGLGVAGVVAMREMRRRPRAAAQV